MNKKPDESELFNALVRERLKAAALVPNTDMQPNARIKAIEKATKFAQQQQPKLFKKEYLS